MSKRSPDQKIKSKRKVSKSKKHGGSTETQTTDATQEEDVKKKSSSRRRTVGKSKRSKSKSKRSLSSIDITRTQEETISEKKGKKRPVGSKSSSRQKKNISEERTQKSVEEVPAQKQKPLCSVPAPISRLQQQKQAIDKTTDSKHQNPSRENVQPKPIIVMKCNPETGQCEPCNKNFYRPYPNLYFEENPASSECSARSEKSDHAKSPLLTGRASSPEPSLRQCENFHSKTEQPKCISNDKKQSASPQSKANTNQSEDQK